MDEKYSDLTPEIAVAIADTLSSQEQESFSKVVETDKWLSQHNFLVNAGGAIAVLGYMGTASSTVIAAVPLSIFILGIIASGIEIRSLLTFYSLLHSDAIRRRGGFVTEELSVKEAAMVSGTQGSHNITNHWCGIFAQWAFVLGSLFGIVGLLCKAL